LPGRLCPAKTAHRFAIAVKTYTILPSLEFAAPWYKNDINHKHELGIIVLREAQDSALQAVSLAELSVSVCVRLRLIHPLRSRRLCGEIEIVICG